MRQKVENSWSYTKYKDGPLKAYQHAMGVNRPAEGVIYDANWDRNTNVRRGYRGEVRWKEMGQLPVSFGWGAEDPNVSGKLLVQLRCFGMQRFRFRTY